MDPPEARVSEWTWEFKHRFNLHALVDYDCTSQASGEEWNDDDRDDDITTDSPEERQRQKQGAISRLIPGHHTLLAEPTSDEIHKGLMSSKLHRASG